MVDFLLNDIQIDGWKPEYIASFIETASPEQFNTVESRGVKVLFAIIKLSHSYTTPAQERQLVNWFKTALDRGANPNIINNSEQTPLMNIVETVGKRTNLIKPMIQALKRANADFNMQDEDGETALFIACSKDLGGGTGSITNVVKLLINNGSDVTIADDNGITPLMSLLMNEDNIDENLDAIKFLVEKIDSSELQYRREDNGDTVLMMAVILRKVSVVQVILSGGDPGINLKNNDGETALMIAASSDGDEQDQIIKLLLDSGANKNLKNNNGQTAYEILKEVSPFSTVANDLLPDTSLTVGPVRSVRGTRSTATRPSNLEAPRFIRRLERLLVDDDLPTQAATPGRRRSRDELEKDDEDEDEEPWEAKRKDIKVNVNQTVTWFDPIMQEEETVNIKDYLSESPNNIVIAYGPELSQFFFTDRDKFARQKDDATFFACKDVDTLRPSNIIRSKPLYDLKFIGLIDGGFCDVSVMTAKPTHQVFAIDSTDKTYPSFVSDNVLNHGADFVSGLHCQAGQERRVTILIAATPVETAIGGRRRKSSRRVTRRKKRAGKSKTKINTTRHKHRSKRASGGKPRNHKKTKKHR